MKKERRYPPRSRRRGLSLVEVVVSTMLVAMLLVGAMNCLGAVVRGRRGMSDQARGPQLAQQLMTEILNTDYRDAGPSPVFGLETGESAIDRTAFDDVDDFHGWSKNPPQHRDGAPVFNASNWQRDVSVEWVDPGDLTTLIGTDQGLKRVIVTVRYSGNVVNQLFAIRSSTYEP